MARLRDGVPELRHEDGDGLGEEPVHLQVGNPIQVAEPMQVWFIYWTYKTQYVELNVERLNVEILNVEIPNVKLPELGKVTLKSNGDEALSDESP